MFVTHRQVPGKFLGEIRFGESKRQGNIDCDALFGGEEAPITVGRTRLSSSC